MIIEPIPDPRVACHRGMDSLCRSFIQHEGFQSLNAAGRASIIGQPNTHRGALLELGGKARASKVRYMMACTAGAIEERVQREGGATT
jgi:hypothetical protein